MKTLILEWNEVQLMINDYSLFELWLNAQNYDIINIPNYLTNSYYFNKITKLPNNIEINNLNIQNSNIEYLPDDIIIKNGIAAYNSKLKKLPNNLKLNTLYIQNSNIKYLPEDLKVTKILNMKNTLIQFVPVNCLNCELIVMPDGYEYRNT